jgi:hypothetical protein
MLFAISRFAVERGDCNNYGVFIFKNLKKIPELLVLAFLYIKLKKTPKLLVSVFLYIKLKKNARSNNSGIFTSKTEKKNAEFNSSSVFTSKTEKNKCWNQ